MYICIRQDGKKMTTEKRQYRQPATRKMEARLKRIIAPQQQKRDKKNRALTRAKTSCPPHLIYIYRTGKTYKANKNNFNKKLVIIKKR